MEINLNQLTFTFFRQHRPILGQVKYPTQQMTTHLMAKIKHEKRTIWACLLRSINYLGFLK